MAHRVLRIAAFKHASDLIEEGRRCSDVVLLFGQKHNEGRIGLALEFGLHHAQQKRFSHASWPDHKDVLQ